MQINTVRFGQVEIDESKIITFNEGLPGIEDRKSFAILHFEDSYPIIWLQSLDDEGICLPVTDTFTVWPEYAFELEDKDAEEIGIDSVGDLHVLSVLLIPEKLEMMTINLVAPIVINMTNGMGKQVVLSSSEYNIRQPVFSEIIRVMKEQEATQGGVNKEEKADAGSVKEDK